MIYSKGKNEKDICYILDNLRMEDLHEVECLRGKNSREDILKEIMENNGYFVMSFTEDEMPTAMGGLANMGNGIGCVWLLSTPEILKYQISAVRKLKKDILAFDKDYWLTYNMLYKENYIAKRWLQYCGYRFPQDEKVKNIYDKSILLQIKPPEGFEVFYRKRKVRGLS